MRLIRRVAATLAMAVIAAVGVRLGGKGGTPRQHGGWKPVDLDTFDQSRSATGDTTADAPTVTELHVVTGSDDAIPVAVVVNG